MATIRDIATLAGTSAASVSRILNNDPAYQVTDETRSRVLDAARQLAYPYEKLRKSPAGSKRSIACMVNMTYEKYDDSYYMAILGGLKDELSKYNYYVDYIQSQYDFNEADNIKNLIKQNVAGIVLMTTPSAAALKMIENSTENIVGMDTGLIEYDNVRYNRFEAGCKAMQYLVDQGHEKIAYIGSHIKSSMSLHFGRYNAYRTIMKRNNFEVNPAWIVDCKWQRQLCFEMTKKLLREKDAPTALFFASDYMAIASIAAIHEEGKSVPQDISIIGISDIDEAKYLNPPLTTIRVPQYEIGQILASTLLSRIGGDKTPPKQIYVPSTLIIRQSVAALPRKD